MLLELNIKGLCKTNGIEFDDFLADLDADNVFELSIYDLEAICEEYEIDLQALLFKPLFSVALPVSDRLKPHTTSNRWV